MAEVLLRDVGQLLGRYLAASAVIGSLLCYFTRHLTIELAIAVFLALPLLSAGMYVLGPSHVRMRAEEGPSGACPIGRRPAGRFSSARRSLWCSRACSGCSREASSQVARLFSPWPTPLSVIGVGVAGVFLALMYLSAPVKPDLRLLHKTSILFVRQGHHARAVCDLASRDGGRSRRAHRLHALDLISLIFTIDLIRTFDLRSGIVIGLNRGLEYAAFAVGIVAGYLTWGTFGGTPEFPLRHGLRLGAGQLRRGAVPARGERRLDGRLLRPLVDVRGRAPEVEVVKTRGRWRAACDAICEEYGLSPREREIFPSIAKGRNAEYIQNAFVISGHTAKTHISNIYRKLGVHSLQELFGSRGQQEGGGRGAGGASALSSPTWRDLAGYVGENGL